MTPPVVTEYEAQFARYFGAPQAFAFWKGRVALYAILKALGVGQGDEVVLPGYTCRMNVLPIKYLGARPIYVDIEADSFNIDPRLIDAHLSLRTKAIIAQHTYGLPARLDAILEIANRKGLPVVEDCCLALGTTYQGRLLGTYGVAAYFSSQWNKPYTTGLGGMVLCGDSALAQRIHALRQMECVPVPHLQGILLAAQLAAYRAFVYPRTTALLTRAFRWLSRKGVLIGSATHAETGPPVMARDFFKAMSGPQARAGVRQLGKLDQNIAHRRRMAELYDALLQERGWTPLRPPACSQPVLVRYPVRIADKDRALAVAGACGIELGGWFLSPMHPIRDGLEVYDYHWGVCPVAEKAAREVVNLPLHPRVSESTARRTVDFLCQFEQVR